MTLNFFFSCFTSHMPGLRVWDTTIPGLCGGWEGSPDLCARWAGTLRTELYPQPQGVLLMHLKKKKIPLQELTSKSKDSIFSWLQSQMIYLRNQSHEGKITFFEQCHLETVQKCHFPGATARLHYHSAPWPASTGKLQSVEHAANIWKVLWL